MSSVYGPQPPSWDDVQAAHASCWDAVQQFGLGSPESVQAIDLAASTHHNHVRHEVQQAEPEAGQ